MQALQYMNRVAGSTLEDAAIYITGARVGAETECE